MRQYFKMKSFLMPIGVMMMGVMCSQNIVAQHQTSSPYSMFGVGVVNPGGMLFPRRWEALALRCLRKQELIH